jgi:hypothetical protein
MRQSPRPHLRVGENHTAIDPARVESQDTARAPRADKGPNGAHRSKTNLPQTMRTPKNTDDLIDRTNFLVYCTASGTDVICSILGLLLSVIAKHARRPASDQ